MRNACAGGGAKVAVAGIIVGVAACTGMVGVGRAVGLARLGVPVGGGIAVGTLPTGFRTFRIYVRATSYRHERRLLIAGI